MNKEAKEKLEQERKIRAMLLLAVEPSAYDRLTNVKVSNESLYYSAVKMILSVYQRKGRKLTEQEVLSILKMIKGGNKKEGSISFIRK